MAASMVLTAESPPLHEDERGSIRVAGTRVTLDTVVGAYRRGSSAEQIVDSFPSLNIGDVYLVLGYVLRHQQEVDEYLARRAEEAKDLRERIEEAQPQTGLRERLAERRVKSKS